MEELLDGMLTRDPHDRFGLHEVLCSGWMMADGTEQCSQPSDVVLGPDKVTKRHDCQ